jgi:hypothetical protein
VDPHRYVNPYIAGSPVTGAEMFYGRQDVFSFVQRNLIGRHRDTPVVLYGQRRTGKTSVLYQLHRHLDIRYRCIFIDLHGLNLSGMSNFLLGIASSVSRALRRDYQLTVKVPDRDSFTADPRSAFEVMFLDKMWPALGEDHLVLMLDEVMRLDEEVRAGHLEREVFDYLRHLMQHYTHLSFIFSLGSGLEEMAKDYAFLFSVSLYHRISFLEPAAAAELITRPVQDHYQVSTEAVDRILDITSGHPYYTQLVCHCAFDLWARSPREVISAADIDGVLAEAIELGSANLTYVWEDSTPEEQAMMAGVAAAMRGGTGSVTVDDARGAWLDVGVALPEREAGRALRSLISREVLAGDNAYSFTVDLQRLWLDRHRRLDWVKDELAETIAHWNRPAEPWPADMIPVRREPTGSVITTGSPSGEHHEPGGASANTKSQTAWRKRYFVVAASLVLLAAYLAATSAAHVFPFPSPAPNLSLMQNLTQLLPGDLSQNENECHSTSASSQWKAPGLVQAVHCADPLLAGGSVYAYQLDSVVHFKTAWQNFNQWWRFSLARAAKACPPPGTAQGKVDLSRNEVPEAVRSVLECGPLAVNHVMAPAYVWSYPANNAFVIVRGAPGSSYSALDYWANHATMQKNP